MSTITLIVIPGPGARTVNIDADTTVAQLISNENLGSIELTNEDIVISEIEESTIGSVLIFTWIILSILISFGIGIRRRFS